MLTDTDRTCYLALIVGHIERNRAAVEKAMLSDARMVDAATIAQNTNLFKVFAAQLQQTK